MSPKSGHTLTTLLIVTSVFLVAFTGGYGTTAMLFDEETVETSVSTADAFPTGGTLGVDYVIDLGNDSGELVTTSGTETGWVVESTDPGTVSIRLRGPDETPLTVAVGRRGLLDALGATDLTDTRSTLNGSTDLKYRIESANGARWLVFTIPHPPTDLVEFSTSTGHDGPIFVDRLTMTTSIGSTNNTSSLDGAVDDDVPENSTSNDTFASTGVVIIPSADGNGTDSDVSLDGADDPMSNGSTEDGGESTDGESSPATTNASDDAPNDVATDGDEPDTDDEVSTDGSGTTESTDESSAENSTDQEDGTIESADDDQSDSDGDHEDTNGGGDGDDGSSGTDDSGTDDETTSDGGSSGTDGDDDDTLADSSDQETGEP